MSAIWLRRDGTTEGPLATDEVRRRFAAGELAGDTMSWRVAEPGWQSLGRRWGASRRIAGWHWLAWLLLVTGAAVLLGWNWIWEAWVPLPERSGERLVASGAVLACVLAALALAYALATSLPRRRLTPPALYALGIALLAMAFALPQQHLRSDLLDVLQAVPNARVEVDAAGGQLLITGEIGPRLLADIEKAWAAHPDITLVTIDSPGGLMAEAERAGRWIAGHGMPVRIRSECSSACVLIWAASPDRQMLASARVGLHRASSQMDLPASALRPSLEQVDRRYRELLRKAGFGEDLLDIQRNTDASAMHWLTAAELLDRKIRLTAVDAAGGAVADARLRWESMIARRDAQDPMAALMAATARRLPQVVDSYASKMYWAADNGNGATFGYHEDTMLFDIKRDALRRASDAAVVAWWEPEQDAYAAALQAQDAVRCATLTGLQSPMPGDVLSFHQSRLTALVDSLPEQAAPRTATPEQVFRDGQAYSRLAQQAYLDLAGRLNDRPERWNAMQRCAFVVSLGRQLQRLPLAERAAMIRHAALQ